MMGLQNFVRVLFFGLDHVKKRKSLKNFLVVQMLNMINN